jgi:hypothetical protein
MSSATVLRDRAHADHRAADGGGPAAARGRRQLASAVRRRRVGWSRQRPGDPRQSARDLRPGGRRLPARATGMAVPGRDQLRGDALRRGPLPLQPGRDRMDAVRARHLGGACCRQPRFVTKQVRTLDGHTPVPLRVASRGTAQECRGRSDADPLPRQGPFCYRRKGERGVLRAGARRDERPGLVAGGSCTAQCAGWGRGRDNRTVNLGGTRTGVHHRSG